MNISSRNMKNSGLKLILRQTLKFRYPRHSSPLLTLLKLVSGTAEVFGSEIVSEQTYTFTGTKAAIFSYHGATLFVRGSPTVAYVAGETPMSLYINLHFTLEKRRQGAEDSHQGGPRILILGSENAGKTSLAQILISYAVRQGRKPVFVGLDPKQVPHLHK